MARAFTNQSNLLAISTPVEQSLPHVHQGVVVKTQCGFMSVLWDCRNTGGSDGRARLQFTYSDKFGIGRNITGPTTVVPRGGIVTLGVGWNVAEFAGNFLMQAQMFDETNESTILAVHGLNISIVEKDPIFLNGALVKTSVGAPCLLVLDNRFFYDEEEIPICELVGWRYQTQREDGVIVIVSENILIPC